MFACWNCRARMSPADLARFHEGPAIGGLCNACGKLYCQKEGCYRLLYTERNGQWHPPPMRSQGNEVWFECPACVHLNKLVTEGNAFRIIHVDPPRQFND